ncbi:MAG: hypothetical protein C0410_13090, partial [Anaerolinea sp.]|nr:hypothetical protein [Anaerolinea sp.]
MRKAIKIVSSVSGIIAGLAGMEHGIFEVLQKNAESSSLMFASMGAPCDAAAKWNGCEPAMSIISNFMIMGIITIVLGFLLSIWSGFFINRKGSGWITLMLSILLLLFGGGFFPPIIGIISGIAANSIHKPISTRKMNGFTRLMAIIWPWPLVYFSVWSFGQFLLGYFFNDFLKTNMLLFTLLF